MLFKVTKNDFFEDNPQAKTNEYFGSCTSREMKYICKVYDPESLLARMPIKERKLRALVEAGFNLEKDGRRPDKNAREMMNGKYEHVQLAIREYQKILPPDENKELAMAVQTQLDEMKAFLKREKKTEGEWRIAIVILKDMPKILKDRNEIFELLGQREILDKDAAGEEPEHLTLSTLDDVNEEQAR